MVFPKIEPPNKQKINYEDVHEQELQRERPADYKPAVVNAIMRGRLGVPTTDGFTATFMDLANRGYISLRNLRPEEIGSSRIPKTIIQMNDRKNEKLNLI